MKINLECGNVPRNGYVNLHSSAISDMEALHPGIKFNIAKPDNLSPITGDDTVEELILNKPINIFKLDELARVLSHWRDKMKVNGVVKINAIDIRRLSEYINNGSVELNEIHGLIFGQPGMTFQSVIDVQKVIEIVTAVGFRIEGYACDKVYMIMTLIKI